MTGEARVTLSDEDLMRALRVRLTIVLWALFLSIACVFMSHVSIAGGKSEKPIYFVAGTITSGGYIQTYPVTLYRVGDHQKLALVHQIHSSEQGLIDFADDLHGRMYFVSAVANGKARMTILHENDPERVDVVSLEDFSDLMCWGAVGGDRVAMSVQYCPGDKIIQVLGDTEPDKRRIGPGNWALFKSLQYGGDIGGPFQTIGGALRILRGNFVLPGNLQAPRVVLSELPPGVDSKTSEGRFGGVLAATDRFFVFLMPLSEFVNRSAVTTEDPGHAGPLHVYIHDKLNDKWRVLDLPTTVTGLANAPIRIFDRWLVTSVAEWRPGPDESPGHDQERKWSNAQFPDVNGGYGSLFIDLFLPGRLILDNLTDGRRIALETGQEDSEVLAIENDGRILYRANDSIYLAKIDGAQIEAPTLVVKAPDVPEVHWAFWGPATRSGTATR